MSAAGSIWPNTPDHPPIWWLAAEIIAESEGDHHRWPEDSDKRVWCAAQYPALHAHWIERLTTYLDVIRPPAPQTPDPSLPPLDPSTPTRKLLIEVAVPTDWEKRLDMQWVIEREIAADRWNWRWA